MDKHQALSQWLNASGEAFCDFVAQSFYVEEFLDPGSLMTHSTSEWSKLEGLKGSTIHMSLPSKETILYFLSKEDALTNITHRILNTDPAEGIDFSDVVDSIKEVANVVAGGVKSRLNYSFDDDIKLSIPSFIESFTLDNTKDFLIGSFMFDNIEFYILVGQDKNK